MACANQQSDPAPFNALLCLLVEDEALIALTMEDAFIDAGLNEGYDPDEAQVIAKAAVAAYQRKMLEMMDTDAGEAEVTDRPPVPPTAARAWSSEADDADDKDADT